jgi:hypothetical protein
VTFGWAHDDEIRKVETFLEMLGVDITFGINRERRDFFLAGGSMVTKKAFTPLRFLTPSKQQQTYTWIMNETMTYLLTPTTLKFND